MLKLIIGNKAYSSWSLRGWLACKQSGLPFEEVVVPIYDAAWEARKQAADLAPSSGKIPTLWDGETVVWDSIAIIAYLDQISGGDKFWPQDRAARAMALSLVAEMHAGYVALRSEHPMNVRAHFPPLPPSAAVQADLARIMELWAQARARFGGEGPFLFSEFGAVDIMFAPVCTRITSYGLPAPRFASAYIDAVYAHPWMQEWIAAAQEETWVIDKYEPAPAS
ncbi:MAG: glutathione S-transferase family protein [Sphingomonas sp.]|jgi:glutathione S-transferase